MLEGWSVGGKECWREECWREECWREGVLEGRSVGGKECWREGVLEGRSVGGKECWREGVLEGRSVGGMGLQYMMFAPVGPMNKQLLILLGIFVLASISSFIRAIFFDTAGEKFVARLRRNVGLGLGLELRFGTETKRFD